MPIVRIIQIDSQTKAGIWEITEDEAFFQKRVHRAADATHPRKRLQHLAARYILPELFAGFPLDNVVVDPYGKPYLAKGGYYISLSHCMGYAAAIASRRARVGIDIEQISTKVSKVADKFLEESERDFISEGSPELHFTLCWCAKEAMYKWYGGRGLDFRAHMRIHPFEIEREGQIGCSFLFPGHERELTLFYRRQADWCVVWLTAMEAPDKAGP